MPRPLTHAISLQSLYNLYVAGFNHGVNEGPFPEHGTYEAFERMLRGESPLEDGWTCQLDLERLAPETE